MKGFFTMNEAQKYAENAFNENYEIAKNRMTRTQLDSITELVEFRNWLLTVLQTNEGEEAFVGSPRINSECSVYNGPQYDGPNGITEDFENAFGFTPFERFDWDGADDIAESPEAPDDEDEYDDYYVAAQERCRSRFCSLDDEIMNAIQRVDEKYHTTWTEACL